MSGYSSDMEGAKAKLVRANISPKHAMAICSAIRGKRVPAVKVFLENVMALKDYVPLKRFNRKVPHRTGGQPGRYHVKAARHILKLVKSAESNAEDFEMDAEKLVVGHACAHKGVVYQRRRSKGKWKTSNIDTTNIEVILKEV